MSYSFIQHLAVSPSDLDDLNHVNNVRYVYWAQEIAKAHWQDLTKNYKQELGVWVVRSHEIVYKQGAFLGDHLKVVTYVETAKGALSKRIVNFFNAANGRLLVQCKTEWCYLESIEKRKPIRIPEAVKILFGVKM